MRTWVRSLALLSGLRIQRCRELWCKCRHSSDLVLLWLWRRLAAVALIQPPTWELPYVVGVALKRQKKKKIIWENAYEVLSTVPHMKELLNKC